MEKFCGFLLAIASLLIPYSVASQPLSQKTLLTIADSPVTVNEFKSIYLKNTGLSDGVDSATLNDYLTLFVNFKLKVHEAKELKLDTSATFMSEYRGYIKQLAQPYLTDSVSDVQLIDEAYERMRYEISASHILINVPELSRMSDTLVYFQKAMDARTRILKGEPFPDVARGVSNDPSVTRNNGYLGFFTAFQMVYPFETAAYATVVDSLSMPVRTRFGYHIIKVHAKRPARGKVKIAHILIRLTPNASPVDAENARKKIVELHTRIKSGEDFAAVARQESQDPASAKSGGELSWIGSGQIIPEMENVAFAIPSNGSVSEPFQSPFGWHIIKRLDRKEIGSKSEMLPEIKMLVTRDSRNAKSRESFVRKLKSAYRFKEDPSKLFIVQNMLDSTVYKGQWHAKLVQNDAVLFSFDGGEWSTQAQQNGTTLFTHYQPQYRVSDFVKFIEQNQRFAGHNSLAGFVSMAYNEWVSKTILDYEESILPLKYPDFKLLSQEYLEGMLLFELSNQLVWQKSSDSLGLANYYQLHKDSYKWGERVHYAVYTVKDVKVKDRLVKGLAKRKKQNVSPADYIAQYNGSSEVVTVQTQVASPDVPAIADYKSWKNGVKVNPGSDGAFEIIEFLMVTHGDVKGIDDCRGEVVADYQENLESNWITTLRAKYPVNINAEVWSELLESLKTNN